MTTRIRLCNICDHDVFYYVFFYVYRVFTEIAGNTVKHNKKARAVIKTKFY